MKVTGRKKPLVLLEADRDWEYIDLMLNPSVTVNNIIYYVK